MFLSLILPIYDEDHLRKSNHDRMAGIMDITDMWMQLHIFQYPPQPHA